MSKLHSNHSRLELGLEEPQWKLINQEFVANHITTVDPNQAEQLYEASMGRILAAGPPASGETILKVRPWPLYYP